MILKEEIHPYKRPMGEIYRLIFHEMRSRLMWDLNPESRRSMARFKKLKDSHKGEKAVMLFNGPSLLKANFDLLKNVFTFGINKVNLLTELKGFEPSIVIAFDELTNQQNKDFFCNSPHLLKILNYTTYKEYKKSGDDMIYLYHVTDPSFCYDPTTALANRGSTPYIAFQIAYYIGFQEIAIVGADHNFPNYKPLALMENEADDQFHFHRDYHKKGQQNQYPDKARLELIFRDANIAFEEKGRKIYNATDGGMLETFERITLEKFLSS